MITKEIQQLVQMAVAESGYQLWGCEYIPQGKHSFLRVYIDKEAGITIDDCEKLSRRLSAMLDVEDLLKGHYSLEVSSPGIPRPLFYKEQYQQYIGHNVALRLHTVLNGKRKFIGIIQSVHDNSITLDVDGEKVEVQFSQIVKAHLTGE